MDLEKLNLLSRAKSFEIPKFSEFKASRFEKWAPETLTPWVYLEAYSQLDEDIKLRYNQLQALAINELFVWFEENLLIKVLKKIMVTRSFDVHFFEACEIFCREEEKHSEMFKLLNRSVAPELYTDGDFYLLESASTFRKAALEVALKFPQFLTAWCWVAVFFEERTLMFSKEYLKSSSNVSSAFTHAHRLHMIEEARHVQMDQYFIDAFYKGAKPYQRKMTAWILKRVLENFASPQKMSKAIAKRLKLEFVRPKDQKQIDLILKELPALRTNKNFQRQFFGPEAAYETFNLMKDYPEFNVLHGYFIDGETTSRGSEFL